MLCFLHVLWCCGCCLVNFVSLVLKLNVLDFCLLCFFHMLFLFMFQSECVRVGFDINKNALRKNHQRMKSARKHVTGWLLRTLRAKAMATKPGSLATGSGAKCAIYKLFFS